MKRESGFFKMDAVTSLLCLIPILIGVFFYDRMPVQMAVHFNTFNEADGYASREFALFGMPLIMLGVHLIICLFTELDQGRKNIPMKMQYFVRLIIPVISMGVQSLVILYALDKGVVNINKAVSLALGALFIAVGGLLPKCGRNTTIGIKIPTTLRSDENWIRTHRLASPIWVGAGIVTLVAALAGNYTVIIFCAAAAALIPCVYSVVIAKKEREGSE